MPPDTPLNSADIEQTRYELREGLETSREMVRKSRVLIELSESDRPPSSDADDSPAAN